MRFAFIFSEDYSLLKKEMKKISTDFFSKTSLSSATHTFWGDEPLNADFWETLIGASLDPRADFIILRKAELFNAETWKNLSESLGTLRENCFIIFCIESAWEKNEPKVPAFIKSQRCYTFAEKKKWFFKIPPLKANDIPSYLQKGMQNRGLTADKNILNILSTMLPPTPAIIDSTLDQLSLANKDLIITEENLKSIATSTPEILLFDYIKFLEGGKSYTIWQNLLLENNAEEIFFPFLAILTREARQLWQIVCNDSALKLPSFIMNTKRNTAQKLGKRGIATLFSALSEADYAIKSGRKTVSQSMEELLFKLTLLYKMTY